MSSRWLWWVFFKPTDAVRSRIAGRVMWGPARPVFFLKQIFCVHRFQKKTSKMLYNTTIPRKQAWSQTNQITEVQRPPELASKTQSPVRKEARWTFLLNELTAKKKFESLKNTVLPTGCLENLSNSPLQEEKINAHQKRLRKHILPSEKKRDGQVLPNILTANDSSNRCGKQSFQPVFWIFLANRYISKIFETQSHDFFASKKKHGRSLRPHSSQSDDETQEWLRQTNTRAWSRAALLAFPSLNIFKKTCPLG